MRAPARVAGPGAQPSRAAVPNLTRARNLYRLIPAVAGGPQAGTADSEGSHIHRGLIDDRQP